MAGGSLSQSSQEPLLVLIQEDDEVRGFKIVTETGWRKHWDENGSGGNKER